MYPRVFIKRMSVFFLRESGASSSLESLPDILLVSVSLASPAFPVRDNHDNSGQKNKEKGERLLDVT